MIKFERQSKETPCISIVCIAYNHADLINQALEGFLNQNVECEYEIILHDDASTDNTQDILKSFYEQHPDKVTLLLQTENQNSNPEVDITCLAITHAQGKYIALCEGDDYWIDSQKLQKQYDALEKNNTISACFHSAFTEKPNGERAPYARHKDTVHEFSAEEVILGDGGFMPTSALFFRKESFEKMYDQRLIRLMPCGDYFFQVIVSSEGGAVYLPDAMSIYRIEQAQSFSSGFVKENWEVKARFYQRMCDAIRIVDEITHEENTLALKEMIRRHHRSYKKNNKRALKNKIKHKITRFFTKVN